MPQSLALFFVHWFKFVLNWTVLCSDELKSEYGITGFPSLKFFPKGSDKSPEDYKEGRTVPDMLKFVNEKTGAHRYANLLRSLVKAVTSQFFLFLRAGTRTVPFNRKLEDWMILMNW